MSMVDIRDEGAGGNAVFALLSWRIKNDHLPRQALDT
jgi:hypothetical protein